jgi:hypothetical protein
MFTEPLPSNDSGDTDTGRLMGVTKYAAETGSGVIIYKLVPSFRKSGSGFQKLIRGGDIETHKQQGDFINLLYFIIISKAN